MTFSHNCQVTRAKFNVNTSIILGRALKVALSTKMLSGLPSQQVMVPNIFHLCQEQHRVNLGHYYHLMRSESSDLKSSIIEVI